MVCSKLKLATPSAGLPGMSLAGSSGLSKPGSDLEAGDAQLALQHWCLSNDNIMRSIAKAVRNPGTYSLLQM